MRVVGPFQKLDSSLPVAQSHIYDRKAVERHVSVDGSFGESRDYRKRVGSISRGAIGVTEVGGCEWKTAGFECALERGYRFVRLSFLKIAPSQAETPEGTLRIDFKSTIDVSSGALKVARPHERPH